MKQLLIVFCCFIFSTFSSNAQLSKRQLNEVESLKNLPFLILLNGSDKFNQDFKSAVEQEWNYIENYTFITATEFVALEDDKKNNGKYGVMRYNFADRILFAPANSISLSLLGEKTSICNASLYMTDENISNGDLNWLLQRLQLDIQFADDRINMDKKAYKAKMNEYLALPAKLKTMTLLIDENAIDDKLKDKISSIYPYKYKIVSKDEINLAIINEEENIAYFRVSAYKSPPTVTTDRTLVSEDSKEKVVFEKTNTGLVTNYSLKTIFDAKEKISLITLRPSGLKFGNSEKSNQLSVKDIEEIVKMIK